MKRLLLVVAAVCLLVGVAVFSGANRSAQGDVLQIKADERNPWTHLRLNNDPEEFQFAIVSDRTGGHRAKVFSQAVEQLNMLQPEFIVSVGDLIEGGKTDQPKLEAEWKEFEGFIARLQMPFFYVPGNHDLSNTAMDKLWQEKFGRRYYHFVYRNVLFLLLNSEDPPGVGDGHFSEEQIAYVARVLEENPAVRWTIVALHKPVWANANVSKTGWLEIEKLLAGRPYTVFAGHHHIYKKFLRHGQRYYQLATTGGSSKMRGVRYGEFDHVVWVTMKKDGPLLANILVDGILDDDLKNPVTEEPANPRTKKPTYPVRGRVLLDGAPVPDALIVFHPVNPGTPRPPRIDALVEADGTFMLTTYGAHDGAPAGDYTVTVSGPAPADPEERPKNAVPARYNSPSMSPLKAVVKEDGANEFTFELMK